MRTLASITIPRQVRPKDTIKAAEYNALLAVCAALLASAKASQVISSNEIGVKNSGPNGQLLFLKTKANKSTNTPAAACPFGKIVTIEGSSALAISGGTVTCGTENWNLDPEVIDLETDGAWLVSIPVDCIANIDDAGEVLLPEINTGTRPTAPWTLTAWTAGTDYPSNTAPSIPAGEGTIVLPIGKLTIASGVPTLAATGCGGFAIGHCAGTLTSSRS